MKNILFIIGQGILALIVWGSLAAFFLAYFMAPAADGGRVFQ
tara:strand:- start:78 stop:203 length:126 start_codon:yes stop_codon:yes gene_type:complete